MGIGQKAAPVHDLLDSPRQLTIIGDQRLPRVSRKSSRIDNQGCRRTNVEAITHDIATSTETSHNVEVQTVEDKSSKRWHKLQRRCEEPSNSSNQWILGDSCQLVRSKVKVGTRPLVLPGKEEQNQEVQAPVSQARRSSRSVRVVRSTPIRDQRYHSKRRADLSMDYRVSEVEGGQQDTSGNSSK
ncbi:hypothetical protein FF1_032097 [Malus domestica]